MLKRVVCIYLLASLILSLCACGPAGEKQTYDDLMDQLKSQAPETETPQRTLTIGQNGRSDFGNFLYNHAAAYMAEHPDVSICLEVFDDWDGGTELPTRLMSGAAPDLIAVTNLWQLQEGGHLTDLYPFLERDPDFHEEDYFMNIVNSSSLDGKLYGFPINFYIYGLYTMRKDIDPELAEWFETAETVTYGDMMELYEAIGRPAGLNFYGGYSPSDSIAYFYDTAVNLEAKHCAFQTEELRALLERVKAIPFPDAELSPDGILIRSEVTGNILDFQRLLDHNYPYLFRKFVTDRPQDLFSYEDAVFTKPRLVTSSGGKGMFSAFETLAITDSCSDPELAWDFIKFCAAEKERPYDEVARFQRGYQLTVGSYPSVNRKNYAHQCEIITEVQYEYGIDEVGMIPMGEREQVLADAREYLMGLPGQLQLFMQPYAAIDSIIYPDQYLYLTDKQSVDVTLANIQSKVELYLNE